MICKCRERARPRQLATLLLMLTGLLTGCCAHVKECVNVHPYSSAQARMLTLKGRLSDSVFSMQDVSHYNDSVYQEMVWDPATDIVTGTEKLLGPRLFLSLTNECESEFMVPRSVEAYPDWTRQPVGAIVQLVGGDIEHVNPWVPDGVRVSELDCKGRLTELAEGDTLLVLEDIDIFHLFRTNMPRAGKYWVRVGFRNYLWCDTLPPVWIGEIWSDTLRFEIVGNR